MGSDALSAFVKHLSIDSWDVEDKNFGHFCLVLIFQNISSSSTSLKDAYFLSHILKYISLQT